MPRKRVLIVMGWVLGGGLAGVALWSPSPAPAGESLIFTQIAVSPPGSSSDSGDVWRYPPRSRIVAIDLERPDDGVEVLTDDFYAARAPAVSHDGRRVLFSGRRRASDSWQVWEMRVDGSGARQITVGGGEYTDPAYLPGGQIVFTGRVAGGETDPELPQGAVYALFTSAGTDARRITFQPSVDFASTILEEGRILFVSNAPSRTMSRSALLTVRADGTGVRLFHAAREYGRHVGRAWETADGRVVFVEADERDAAGGKLIAVSRSQPFRSRVVLSSGIDGTFRSVVPLPSGDLVVSYRPPGANRFGLYAFDPVRQSLGRRIADEPGYQAVEPVAVAERPGPRKFVSTVDTGKASGELFALDADLSDLPPEPRWARSARVRVLWAGGLLGEVPLESDGSFYVEVPSDTPVRFETVNPAGEVVRGPSAWIWVRPNERRGCIGCHEDRELAPPNHLPLAIGKPPVRLRASPRLVTGRTPAAHGN
ncbi:MAG: hypothetical protein ACE5HQ_10725 [Gemmatimonadota bacterium]